MRADLCGVALFCGWAFILLLIFACLNGWRLRLKFLALLAVLILAVLMLMVTRSAWAKNDKTYGNAWGVIVSVYDGDTLKVDVREWPPILGDELSVRVYGIDAPEMKGTGVGPKQKELAKAAREALLNMCPVGSAVELRNLRRGKFFRAVAEVWCGGFNAGASLLKLGLAKVYYGDAKEGWGELEQDDAQ